MRILVVNCNTSAPMTKALASAASSAARPGTEIVAVQPLWGPESAEGFYDSYITAAAVLDLLSTWEQPHDAVVMAGFGEHGREGARQLLNVPVVDITEAAAYVACLLGHRFGVVTTTRSAVSQIEHSLLTAGLLGRCAAIRATDMRVLDLHDNVEETVDAFVRESRRALADGAEVIVLGCAGTTGLEERLTAELGVPVVDGVAAAVALCESLVGLGLSTSKLAAYAPPLWDKARNGWPVSGPASIPPSVPASVPPSGQGGSQAHPTVFVGDLDYDRP